MNLQESKTTMNANASKAWSFGGVAWGEIGELTFLPINDGREEGGSEKRR